MKSLLKTFVFLFAFVFVFSVSESASQNCKEVSDADIIASMNAKIQGNKNLAPQASHINIVSVNQVIKIQGWVSSQSDFDKVVAYAVDLNCVRLVNVNEFEPQEPAGLMQGCSGGTKPCGDICIPDGDICSIGKGRS